MTQKERKKEKDPLYALSMHAYDISMHAYDISVGVSTPSLLASKVQIEKKKHS